MTEQPMRIEGGISDATKQYLKLLSITRERMYNDMGITENIAPNFIRAEPLGVTDVIKPSILRVSGTLEDLYKIIASNLPIIDLKEAKIFIRKQVRFPKSKVKRIRNKWAKQEKNYRLVEANLTFTFK